MNFLNHNNHINYQNDWYNPNCFNQQNYVNYQMQMQTYQAQMQAYQTQMQAYQTQMQAYQAQMQAYQNNQNQQIFNAARHFGDYIDAVKQVDSNHQFELFLACLSVFGIKMGWNGLN